MYYKTTSVLGKEVKEHMAKDYSFTTCPNCKMGYMSAVGERTGGFSAGKAAVGMFVAGPIGLAAGALGKKKKLYQCNRCGYTIEG